ncbi:MAG: hypothetical protein JF628_07800 [Sphingomonas sp.]|nr:hypothetical protein [Sphingomonas sp.]
MDGAMLFVKDLGEMTAFYRDPVGFRHRSADRRMTPWIEDIELKAPDRLGTERLDLNGVRMTTAVSGPNSGVAGF